jgi:Flp pilus assembly protein TadG
MVRWTKNKIQRFTRRDDGGMTIEFVILFPVLMIIFVSFLGFSIAFICGVKYQFGRPLPH